MHRLDDNVLITDTLLLRFNVEAEYEGGNGQHYDIIQKGDGNFVENNPASPEADASQILFGRDVINYLNRHLNHGGAWVFCLTHPEPPAKVLETAFEYKRFCFIWIDEDGDAQFTLDWQQGASDELFFHQCLDSGLISWADRCETAWTTWHHHMREVLDPKPDQLVKAAKGEKRTPVHPVSPTLQ